MNAPTDILPQWHTLTDRIEKARAHAQLRATHTRLVAVSKAQSSEAVRILLEAGHRLFGENKVQEAEHKFPPLRDAFPDLQLHLIGSLQSNKVHDALYLFDVIETVDRTSLVDALVKERSKSHGRCQTFFVQVNIGEEPQKGGVLPAELPALLGYCRQAALPVSGLMCVPPAEENPAPYFALLHRMAQEHELAELSMGMSGDFETAIRFGASFVRVGTALFGSRQP